MTSGTTVGPDVYIVGGVDQTVLRSIVYDAGCVTKDEPTADVPNELFMRNLGPDRETAEISEREGGMG